ncbi:MAG: chorismate-binding protein, partial [bacterium]
RTIVVSGDRAYMQAGAGIVADSVPEREYVETVNKAKALVRAIERVARNSRGAVFGVRGSDGAIAEPPTPNPQHS